MNETTNNVVEQLNNNDTQKIVINDNVSLPDRAVIESIKRLRNPFAMIDVKYVMKDLNICETVAYRVFRRDDFPSISVGKSTQVMLLAYLIWKMQKRA